MKRVAEGGDTFCVALSDGVLVLLKDFLEFDDLLASDVLRGPCGQLRLSPEEVAHVLLREWSHDEAASGNRLHKAFAPECKESLSDGRRADVHGFGDSLDAEEIARPDFAEMTSRIRTRQLPPEVAVVLIWPGHRRSHLPGLAEPQCREGAERGFDQIRSGKRLLGDLT